MNIETMRHALYMLVAFSGTISLTVSVFKIINLIERPRRVR